MNFMVRTMRRNFGLLVGLAMLSIVFDASAARANVFEAAWEVVTDPIKLKSGSDNLYRSLIELENLEKNANYDIGERKKELDRIVRRSEEQAIADITKFEKTLYIDTSDLIRKVSCVATDALQNDLREAVAKALDALSTSNPGLHIGPFKILDLRAKQVQIDDPSQIYYASRDALLADLTKSVDEMVSAGKPMAAYTIVDTYQNIERLANVAICGYPNQPIKEAEFRMEANKMELKSIPWQELADLSH
jgi:hypothetical protein